MKRTRSSLAAPAVNLREGDTLLAIGGHRLNAATHPNALLVNQSDEEVLITVGDAKGKAARTVTVKTLASEFPARYREWVETNRRIVHEQTKGRVGYVHIPNMGPQGYSEFHRYFLSEIDREGMVVDVRFNGGGHVSELILEKLARRRIAYNHSRWSNVQPYPVDSVAGPMVAITNEYAGSDGDIFSHGFKLLKLGPLIGKRTWGGVIGIWPRHSLIDGSFTTQPEVLGSWNGPHIASSFQAVGVVIGLRNWSTASRRSRSSSSKLNHNDKGNVRSESGGMNRARAAFQKELWTKLSSHHWRQRFNVRESICNASRIRRTRPGLRP